MPVWYFDYNKVLDKVVDKGDNDISIKIRFLKKMHAWYFDLIKRSLTKMPAWYFDYNKVFDKDASMVFRL